MLFALGAVSSALDALQSITAKSSSGPSSGSGKAAANPFDLLGKADSTGTVKPSSGSTSGSSQISAQTMSALLAAQSQSANSIGSTPSVSSDPLQQLFGLIDGNGDGKISKAEFENALGAGGTNLANADSVFGKLDKNGDGNVGLDELKAALQGAGHHRHAARPGDTGGDGRGSKGSGDPLAQALAGASSTSVTNADGSTTTSLTYADGSKVTMTTAAPSTGSAAATSSYNFVEKLIERQAHAVSATASNSLALSA
jgi:hypothetical protein